ncbi:GDSL-type esterase/lipase family protein [Myceligenerans halotolerans]
MRARATGSAVAVGAVVLAMAGGVAAPATAEDGQAHAEVALKSEGSGFDRDQVLLVDGEPYWYNGIQLRADKLLTQIGYRADVPIEEHDPSDPQKRSLEQIYKQVAEDGYNTVNVQVLWSDLQKDKVTTPEQAQSATISADGSPADPTTFRTGWVEDDASAQELGYLRFDIPDDVENVDGSKIRLYVNSSDPRQGEFPGTGGMYYSHYLNLYGVPSGPAVEDLTWDDAGLGDITYDGTDVEAADGSVIEPTSVTPKWDRVKRTYFYDLDVTDHVAQAHAAGEESVSFLVASSTPPERTDKAEVAAEAVTFETAASTRDDSDTNNAWLKQPLRPRMFFSDASMENIDWTYYDKLVRYAEKYGLKFEVIWFGSDSTGWASDYRVPFYVFHDYQMTTVDQDPVNVLYNGSVGTPLFEKKIGEPNSMYTFLGDRADTALMEKEGDMLHAVVEHTATLTDEDGESIGDTLIGVQTQNEPYNGTLNGSPIRWPDNDDGLATDSMSRSPISLAQRDLWRTEGDADHGGYLVTSDSEFRKYQTWYYNDYLGRRVKESSLPVWTRVNHQQNSPTYMVDINEAMRANPDVGTYLDSVGIDTYNVSVERMYNIGNGRHPFNIDKGENLPVVMEDGMNNTYAAEKKFATVAGGALHNGYNACSFDGDGLYDSFNQEDACGRTDRPADARTGDGTPGTMTFAQKIERVALVNHLYNKVGHDLATRNTDAVGGSALKFFDPKGVAPQGEEVEQSIRSVNISYAVVGDPDGFDTNSRGFAIERAADEIALGTTEETTFRLAGLAGDVASVELGTYDADASDGDVTTGNARTDNSWTKLGDAETSTDGDDLVVTVPAGDVARVLTTSGIPPAVAEYRFEAESSSPVANQPIETWDDGASGAAWNKLLATAVGDYIEYTVDVPEAGTYELRTVYRTASIRGIAQASVDGDDVGEPYDLYAETASFPSVTAGAITVAEPGPITLRYTVTGKNEASSGYGLGVDVITLREATTVLLSESFDSPAAAPAFGFDRDAAIADGVLRLTNDLSNEGVAVKKFDPAVARDSLADVSFDWTYHGESNSKGGLEFRDRYGRLAFAMQGATKTDGTRELRYSTTAIDSDSTSSKYAIEPTWRSVPLTVGHTYQVRVRADFAARTVSYRISDGSTTLVENADVPIRAAQLHRIVATSAYKTTTNAQEIDDLVIRGRGDATPAALSGSTLYTFGDSIIAGHMYRRAGIGEFVADQEQMTVRKYAVNGASVIDGSNDIAAQVQAAPSEDPDLVLFDGGTNDAYPATLDKLGTITEGFDGPFDTTTFAGAFEDLIAQLKAKYPTADVVYLAVAKLGARDVAVQETLRDIELDILAKWDVPVADVYTSDLDTTDDDMRVTYSFDSLQPDNGLPGTAETTGSWDDGDRPSGTHPNFPAIEEFYAPIVSRALLDVAASAED